MSLRDMKVKKTKPRSKAYKLSDSKGLYLYVLPSGSKSWRYNYRIKQADERYKYGTYVYGQYPEFGLSEVRQLHIQVRKLVMQGIDPQQHKRDQRRAMRQNRAVTFQVITDEWLEKHKQEVKPQTYRATVQRLQNDILPFIGKLPVTDLKPLDFLEVMKRIEARGAIEMAKRARRYCSKIMRYAVATERAEHDVTAEIKEAMVSRPVKHQPAMQPHEIPELLSILRHNQARLFPQTIIALEVLMRVLLRPIELVSLEWAFLDETDKRLIVPARRMKMGQDHIVPLSKQCMSMLQNLKHLNGHRKYIFPKKTNPREHISRDTLSAALRSLGLQGRQTPHGLRALARTTIREKLRWDSEVIERQLAHKPDGSLGSAYDRTQFIDQRVEMMQAWSNYLDEVGHHGMVLEGKFMSK